MKNKFEELGKVRATARVLGMASCTLSDISYYQVHTTGKRGRPMVLTWRDVAQIKRIVKRLKRNIEKVTAAKVLKELVADVSLKTV